jgi:hypothetical protein
MRARSAPNQPRRDALIRRLSAWERSSASSHNPGELIGNKAECSRSALYIALNLGMTVCELNCFSHISG